MKAALRPATAAAAPPESGFALEDAS